MSPMRRHSRSAGCLYALAVLLIAAGCGQDANTGPAAVPAKPGPPLYGFAVTDAVRAKLDGLERVRRIDPCRVLSLGVVAGSGTVLAHGPGSGLDQCTLTYLTKDGGQRIDLQFTVGGAVSGSTKEPGFDRDVWSYRDPRAGAGFCSYGFYTAPASQPSLSRLPGSLEVSGPGSAGCAVLTPFLPALMRNLDIRPPRDGEKPAVILAGRDPCEFLSKVPRDGIQLRDGISYQCQLGFTNADGSPKNATGSLTYAAARLPLSTPAGSETRKVGGREVYVHRVQERCYAQTHMEPRVKLSPAGARDEIWAAGVISANADTNCDQSVQWALWAAETSAK